MIESITFFKKNRKDKKDKHPPNPEGDLTSEQKGARDIIVFYLHNGDMDNALKTKEKFNLPDEIVHEVVKNRIISLLRDGYINEALKIKEAFNPPDEMLSSPEVYEAAKDGIIYFLRRENIDDALRVKEKFNLPDEIVHEATKNAIIYLLLNGGLDIVPEIKEAFNFPDEMLSSPEVYARVKDEIISLLRVGYIDIVSKIKEALNFSDEMLSSPEVYEAAKDGIMHSLRNGYTDIALKIKEAFNLSDKMFYSPEIKEAFLMGFMFCLARKNDVEKIFEIKEKFGISDEALFPPTHRRVVIKQLLQRQAYQQLRKITEILGITDGEIQGIDAELLKLDVSAKDPYAEHEWLFNGEKIKRSVLLAKVLNGELGIEQVVLDFEIAESDLPRIKEALRMIKEVVYRKYSVFEREITNSPHISEIEKHSLLSAGNGRRTALLNTLFELTSRLFIQTGEFRDFSTNLSENNFANMLNTTESWFSDIIKRGIEAFLKVYEIDIPLYDRLYDEFDLARGMGSHPMEVYLGRDGIYAWLGRRVQDIARRRRMGPQARKRIKESGKVLEIKPRYLVYPRYMRDRLGYIAKRDYLAQERITPDQDPFFFDTGYTGTIPEDIMKVMGFTSEEIERRIKLLSATKESRRIRGIGDSARKDIVEYIEGNAQSENSAEGLIIDPGTGKIKHIAQPASPKDQFTFQMVRQAIVRHYWFEEMNK
ncbi:MAG: hypothetical protein A3F94_02195 [Candidatus Spechtbacteria bacterium RIFCSPLOWO2_12_FULL_38_22]|uniref:Uncharacterized protein n=1 Tax=Candidatus Spechtbacteria bacterium RIFCSPLOWO2_12_FULL_38_22 TaxID=1802165 RepID=A0A1G2HFT0_9BACT|nr:MAG: hypothetical protein A2728_01900 [Candidatus Spechtbacteria bacterium RIFCSPHIGHO2_01_FULL_38_11]OGZ59550.1 MAG: hypothetical protein A3E58_02585 [Candidatus Spechtbacteria bacterium RIFCSPHIGHO2_12_FULL_38_30]OGZ61357.1 MAG: hypothetical protein A3F94_02195 [Candidatus Spechtbacteria bacterium RIFCSPLOWO2_12_FULL_38_22]